MVAWPFATRAQQPRRLAVLILHYSQTEREGQASIAAFLVFVVATAPALAELHRLTSTIPIVFTQVGDPLEAGSVASLARPGGNITGFHGFEAAMGANFSAVVSHTRLILTAVGANGRACDH